MLATTSACCGFSCGSAMTSLVQNKKDAFVEKGWAILVYMNGHRARAWHLYDYRDIYNGINDILLCYCIEFMKFLCNVVEVLEVCFFLFFSTRSADWWCFSSPASGHAAAPSPECFQQWLLCLFIFVLQKLISWLSSKLTQTHLAHRCCTLKSCLFRFRCFVYMYIWNVMQLNLNVIY